MSETWIPDGYTSITPFLCVDRAAAAIEFYVEVFGASVVSRNDLPDGRVAHAELAFTHGRLQLGDPDPAHGLRAPSGDAVVDHSYAAYVPDVDATYAAAVAAGGAGMGEPQTFVTGDRFAVVLDPFGHRWALMTRVEDVDPEEAARRVDAWLAEGADADVPGESAGTA